MSKKILSAISIVLVFSFIFAFAGCSTTTEEESTTVVTAKNPLPTDITTGFDEENSVTVTDTTYSPEDLEKNTDTIFEYFNIHINETTDSKKFGDAMLTIEYGRSIGKTQLAKFNEDGTARLDDNGNPVVEDIPYSGKIDSKTNEIVDGTRNDYIEAAVSSLKDYMVDGSMSINDGEYKYIEDGKVIEELGKGKLEDYLPVAGADYVSALTREDVKSATCVDKDGQRTITVTLKDTDLPETVNKAFHPDNIKNDIMKEFEKTADYLVISEPVLKYSDCQIIITANLKTEIVHTIEYIKRIDVSTTATGKGDLAEMEPTDVHFRYNENVKYLIDRTNPKAPAYLKKYKAPAELGSDAFSGVVSVNGDVYKLPAPVSAFTDNGWTITAQPDSIIAGDFDYITLENGTKTLDAVIINYGEYQTIPANCVVTEITAKGDLKAEIAGGIKIGAKAEDLDLSKFTKSDATKEEKGKDGKVTEVVFGTSYAFIDIKKGVTVTLIVDAESNKVTYLKVTCANCSYK